MISGLIVSCLMREVITLQVGQCGNQIGNAFWNLLLLEHELTSDEDTALSSFFYREQKGRNHVLRARALLVDMECGPLQETMRSPLGNLFNDTQYIMDVSGAGNNFAHGYFFYGPQYQDKLCEGIRRNVERCESLQAFSLIHSLGGGTGSGVGSYLLSLLADEFNKVTRFSTCIYPSEENDVITSPYNTILSTRELVLSADCVFPLKNSALFSFHQSENPTASTSAASVPTADPSRRQKDRGFDLVNLIAARMLCNVTSSSRFHGELNVDLNEIYTNLVPFPKLHFLCGALNIRYPTTAQQRLRSDYSRTALQRAFADVTGPRGQLTGIQGLVLQTSPPIMIASAFLGRGKIILSDFLRCVSRAQSSFRFPVWNSDACKVKPCLFLTVHLSELPHSIRLVYADRRLQGRR